jgi:hypothetical protein
MAMPHRLSGAVHDIFVCLGKRGINEIHDGAYFAVRHLPSQARQLLHGYRIQYQLQVF